MGCDTWAAFTPELIKSPRAVGVKDIINTADFPTQMGSPIYKGFTPGNDARIVSKLKQAGYVIAGKTQCAEFGVHHDFNGTKNPHDETRVAGTSSGGSAKAVAAGQVFAAIGTQTAGSIIRPASWCGVYAFKPSFGLLPRTGILKTTDTLDTVGFFADRPKHLRTLFDVLKVDGPDYPYSDKMAAKIEPLRVGILNPPGEHWPSNGLAFEHIGWDKILNTGYEIHRTIYHKCLSYYFKEEAKSKKVSKTFLKQVAEGQAISVDQYNEALLLQNDYAYLVNELFDSYDVLLVLSSGGPAPEREDDRPGDTCPLWTLAGLPVINIPFFVKEGMPFGISAIARKYDDYTLLRFVESMVLNGVFPDSPNPCLFDIRERKAEHVKP
jgi:Asp-tRNA(Asn)/Glu-tRNA(Gln) amidotransferase A subunit family amidase